MDCMLSRRARIIPYNVIRQKKFFRVHLCNLDIYKS